MERFGDKINANVCYCQTYYMEDFDIQESAGKDMLLITSALIDQFSGISLDDDIPKRGILTEIQTAKEFLYGKQLPFQTKHILLTSFTLSHPVIPVRSSAVLVSIYPEIGIVMVMVNLTLVGANTDQMVFLRHMQGNGEQLIQKETNGSEHRRTVSQIMELIKNTIKTRLVKSQSAYTVEITEVSGYEQTNAIVEKEARRLYGIITGDEGWAYVPAELANLRITQNTWSSREYVSVIGFSSGFLMLNLHSCPVAEQYLVHQRNFFTEYYGEMNPYFNLRSVFAGVNHGLLFAVETGMAIKAFSQSILDRQGNYRIKKPMSFGKAISRIKAFRRQIILTLNRVEDMQMSEIGELQGLVLESLKINPVIDRLKYLLELMESELDLMYSTRTNMLVNIIALVGLIFSLIQVLGIFIDF